MMEKLSRLLTSKWTLLVMLVCLILFVMPANSPVGIPGDYKVIPAVLFVLALFRLIAGKDNARHE